MAPWLWKDLVYLFPLWWGPDDKKDTKLFNVANQEWENGASSSGAGGTIETKATPYGYGLHINVGSDSNDSRYYGLGNLPIGNRGADPYTLFAVCAVKELPSNRTTNGDEVVFGYATESGDVNYPIYFNNNDKIQMWDGSSAAGTTQIEVGRYYVLAVTAQDNTLSQLYVDGVYNAELTLSGMGGYEVKVFDNTSTNRSFDGYCPIFGVWNRHLSEDEIRMLAMDPFIMLRPQEF
jgi:hypothetical protein